VSLVTNSRRAHRADRRTVRGTIDTTVYGFSLAGAHRAARDQGQRLHELDDNADARVGGKQLTREATGSAASLRTEAATAVLTVRFLPALSAPAAGRRMLQSFGDTVRQCCASSSSSGTTTASAQVFSCASSSPPSAPAPAGACVTLESLRVQMLTFEKGALSLDATGVVAGQVAEEEMTPDVGRGGELDVPSWLLPV